jgi:UDP-GlcNAc:undecaprenyl-phosphate/decaprenyl-phosphate GlcNAc-1-phosphate transferase
MISAEILTVFTASIISLLIIPQLIKYSFQRNLVDLPGRRKVHKGIKPSMGGIAIFFGFLVATIAFNDFFANVELKFILASIIIIFLVGLIDDITHLPPLYKLLGQLLSMSLIVLLIDVRLRSFYGLFSNIELPLIVSYLLTVLTMVIITNSLNLIDGLDGLAGTLSIISLTCFGTWFYLADAPTYSILCFALIGSLMGFLVYNWEPSKIFMGDTGSLVLGLSLSIFSIKFLNINSGLADTNSYKIHSSIGTALCFISIPLLDTMRIIILRISKGKSPLIPDKNHIHHVLVRLGFTHRQTVLILAFIQCLYIAFALTFRGLNDVIVVSVVLLASILLSILADRLIISRLNRN